MVTANDQGIGQSVVAGESRRRKLFLAIRQVLLVVGISLLGVFVGARIHGVLLSRMAVLSFGASQQSPTSKARGEGASDANVDFTLWSEKRINAYKQSLAEHWARPLAVLRVSKIHLEA